MYDKIVFLVSSLSQPRAIRRVESIAALGYEVEVYGYDRVQYNCNKFSVKIPVTILGQMSKGDGYLEKIRTVKRDIARVVKERLSDEGRCSRSNQMNNKGNSAPCVPLRHEQYLALRF